MTTNNKDETCETYGRVDHPAFMCWRVEHKKLNGNITEAIISYIQDLNNEDHDKKEQSVTIKENI